MTLAASLLLLGQLKSGTFEHSASPSKTWELTYAPAPGKSPDDYIAVNKIVNRKTKRVAVILKGFDGFPGQNHGGMNLAWSKDEKLAVIVQAGKWEPRAAAIVAPAVGIQINLLSRLSKEAAAFEKGKVAKADKMVYDIVGAKFIGTNAVVSMLGQVPKDEDAPVVYLSIQVPLTLAKSKIEIGKPAIKSLTESTSWSWPESH